MRFLLCIIVAVGVVTLLHLAAGALGFSPKDESEAGLVVFYIFAAMGAMGYAYSILDDVPLSKKEAFAAKVMLRLESLNVPDLDGVRKALKAFRNGDVKDKAGKEFSLDALSTASSILKEYGKRSPEECAFMIATIRYSFMAKTQPSRARLYLHDAIDKLAGWRSESEIDGSAIWVFAQECERMINMAEASSS